MSSPHLALVIGNAAYPLSPLRNPVNDARAMATRLHALGFEVLKHEDATHAEMRTALIAFKRKLKGRTAALVYFAGHGLQVNGQNYLVPVDAEIVHPDEVPLTTVSAHMILDQMADAVGRVNLLILDACRNNPFERAFRGFGRGLAQMSAPEGTLIAYATAHDKTAADGDGDNGLYTSELLKVMQVPCLKIEEVFKRVRKGVKNASSGVQVPWEATCLTEDFYFIPPVTPAPQLPPAPLLPPAFQESLANPVQPDRPVGAGGDDATSLILEIIGKALVSEESAEESQLKSRKASVSARGRGIPVLQGFGEFKSSGRWSYSGEWKNHKFDGHGIKTWTDGSKYDKYEGQWQNGERRGFGALTMRNGEQYKGEWGPSGRAGSGVLTLKGGWRYEGEWRRDKRNGRGVEKAPDGRILQAGIWRDDKLVIPFTPP